MTLGRGHLRQCAGWLTRLQAAEFSPAVNLRPGGDHPERARWSTCRGWRRSWTASPPQRPVGRQDAREIRHTAQPVEQRPGHEVVARKVPASESFGQHVYRRVALAEQDQARHRETARQFVSAPLTNSIQNRVRSAPVCAGEPSIYLVSSSMCRVFFDACCNELQVLDERPAEVGLCGSGVHRGELDYKRISVR